MRSLGRYALTEEIGRGSMGTVYKASDPLIERTVAVKTIDLAKLDDGSLEPRARFLREAKAAGRLNHPGIVTIYDVGEIEDTAFTVMELVEGRSLKDILDRGEKIPLAAALAILSQTADALDFAHRHGVVHRDVKPGNVMLTRHGTVKITDFGIARIDQTKRTRTGILVGSPGYMSPEQLSGKPIDGRSDVFSLGSLLYELAAGRGPFDAERPEDVVTLMGNITSRPHEPPSSVNAALPASIDAIVARALAKRPADRYPSAGEMAADLRRALERDVRIAPGEPDIARLALSPDILLPDFDLFAETAASAAPRPAAAAPQPAPAGAAPPAAPPTGLLARLRSQAEAIEQRDSTGARAADRLMLRFDVERRMRSAFDFYQELVRYIGVVRPEIAHEYRLDGIGSFSAQRVADAFVDSRLRREDGRPWMEMVLLTVVAVSPTDLRVERAPGEVKTLLDRLGAANLRYTSDDPLDGSKPAAIDIAGEITAYARIMADRNRGRIAFLCRNVGGFGTSNFVVDTRTAAETIFEEFANHLLGASSQFLQLATRSSAVAS
ncbi:MAG TPA: serine/threonine-protein kinase [Burkholderiales bacterium]|nr:serine/threonine-protein kinase [Burkholderiales bacterium]